MMDILQRKTPKKQKDGVAIGTRQVAGDNPRPEPIDNAKRLRFRAGVDNEDMASVSFILSWMFLIILAAGTIGFAIRMLIWAAGYREGLF